MLGPRLLHEVDESRVAVDVLEHSLSLELDNGRLFRLMAKLSFVCERPGLGADRRWSETGDRYLLALFRDYVFHQVYEDGRPAIDYGHVVDSLNKLDCGVEEQVCFFFVFSVLFFILFYSFLFQITFVRLVFF